MRVRTPLQAEVALRVAAHVGVAHQVQGRYRRLRTHGTRGIYCIRMVRTHGSVVRTVRMVHMYAWSNVTSLFFTSPPVPVTARAHTTPQRPTVHARTVTMYGILCCSVCIARAHLEVEVVLLVAAHVGVAHEVQQVVAVARLLRRGELHLHLRPPRQRHPLDGDQLVLLRVANLPQRGKGEVKGR
eukprot:1194037-Prorocentrum_minimum.AAC.2